MLKFLTSLILDAKHEKIIRNNRSFLFVCLRMHFCILQLLIFVHKQRKLTWLFPTIFPCLASKIIDVRNQAHAFKAVPCAPLEYISHWATLKLSPFFLGSFYRRYITYSRGCVTGSLTFGKIIEVDSLAISLVFEGRKAVRKGDGMAYSSSNGSCL